MIAPPDSTAETMRRALCFTIAALDAAATLDIDRSQQDRAFFTKEKTTIEESLEKVRGAEEALRLHIEKESVRLQAHVLLGDTVLDRGVRAAKTRMKMELKNSFPEAADLVFGANIADLVDAELKNEPLMVLQAVDRFEQVPDFPDKERMRTDLEQRAESQLDQLAARDEGERQRAKLTAGLVQKIMEASDALYLLEKLLLGRFLRERLYVRQFFLDVRPQSKEIPPQTGQEQTVK